MRDRPVRRILLILLSLGLYVFYVLTQIAVAPTSGELRQGGPAQTPEKEQSIPVGGDELTQPSGEEEPSDAAPEATPEPTAEPATEPTAEPATEPTAAPDSPEGRALTLGLPAPPEIDITSWEFLLANATHNIAEYTPPEIAKVSSSQCPQDARIAEALSSFAQGCSDAGLPVYLSSGYRSYNEQSGLYNNKVSQVGAEQAAKIVAPPGTSEHQTGLCCDITDIYRNPKVPETLSQTKTFQWLNEHCAEYGFILRYPEGKGDITGIIYEPWHFRYVGVEAAQYIKANDLTLEEFVALYTGEDVPGRDVA